jgi:hypothetical protein
MDRGDTYAITKLKQGAPSFAAGATKVLPSIPGWDGTVQRVERALNWCPANCDGSQGDALFGVAQPDHPGVSVHPGEHRGGQTAGKRARSVGQFVTLLTTSD